MKIIPSRSTTKLGNEPYEWIPYDFESLLQELEHIKTHCASINHLAIYRGHRDSRWLLDSTFIRNVKESILGINSISRVRADYRGSLEYHRMLGCLFLYKFGTRTWPSKQLFDLAEEHGIDPWFEWMKRIQQYPENDLGPMWGSFLIDWSQNEKVALYFANDSRDPITDGALWIADVNSMGKVLHQDITVEEILVLFQEALHNDKPFGCPIVFYPRIQIDCKRANNQDAVYVAQMDLRYDLSDIWTQKEADLEEDDRIFIKLILPPGTQDVCNFWLKDNKIVENFIYPDKQSSNQLMQTDAGCRPRR